jgi:hypothetical protein
MAATQDRPKGSKYEPQTVIIRHGIFWYFAREGTVVPNEKTHLLEERTVLVQRIANQNDEITLELESDYNRGVQHHAFWTDEELAQVRALRATSPDTDTQGPTREQLGVGPQEDGGGDDERMPLDYDLHEFDEESDVIEWLQGTGTFDGMKEPNVSEVVKAAREDPELARRLLAAEPLARGDKGPRDGVVTGLNKIIEG